MHERGVPMKRLRVGLAVVVALWWLVAPVLVLAAPGAPNTPPEGYYDQAELVAGYNGETDLHVVLDTLRHVRGYERHVYDCSEMSALGEWVAENSGHNAGIWCSATHCWIGVQFGEEWRAYDLMAGGHNYIERPSSYYAPPFIYLDIYEFDQSWWGTEEGNWWDVVGWQTERAPYTFGDQDPVREIIEVNGRRYQVCGPDLGPVQGGWCSQMCNMGGPPVLVVKGSCTPVVAQVQPQPEPAPEPAPVISQSSLALPPNIAQWESLIVKYAAQYGLDPALVAAVMTVESGGRQSAISSAGAVGLMQVMPYESNPRMFYDRPRRAELLVPDTNVNWGCKILADCIRWRGSIDGGLACYLGAWHNGYISRVRALQRQYGGGT